MRELGSSELIRHCKQGTDGAWEEFLRRYADLIHTTLRIKVGLNTEDLEDAFQNTVLALYQNLPKLRDSNRLAGWIVRIAYNQGVNRIRVRARSIEDSREDCGQDGLEDSIDFRTLVDPPEELLVRLERSQRAREILDLLPESSRKLIELLFYEDPVPEYAEISRRIGIPIGSIGPTRARCLAKMRRLLEERGWSD